MVTIKHPAKYSPELLPKMARYVDGARNILDPFAGTGRVGWLKHHLTTPAAVWANELEREWAAEAVANGCDLVHIGDARSLHWIDEGFDAVVTSPAYGNRMADAANWAEGRKHSTYTSAIRETTGDMGRSLRSGNAGAMQWGDGYREFHREAWTAIAEPLVPGGRLVLNIADHYRDGELQGVPEWHVSALLARGFVLVDWIEVGTARYGFGANAEMRAPELVILLQKPRGFYPPPEWVYTPGDPLGGALWCVKPEPLQLGLFGGVA